MDRGLMNASGFQCFVDAAGDLWIADGMVIDRATGAVFLTGQGDADGAPAKPYATSMDEKAAAPSVVDLMLLGGSGRNVIVSGLAVLAGVWKAGRTDQWTKEIFTMTVTGASAATISDGTDVVAELTSGGTAPAGTFNSTTYGEETYNASASFSLTVTTEDGFPGNLIDLEVTVLDGTAQGGRYTALTATTWESAVNADWTIELNSDGSMAFKYDGVTVAERTSGPDADPCGKLDSVSAGEFLNPEFADDVTPVAGSETNPFGTLSLEFSWPGTETDLDIGVTFLGLTVGFGYLSSTDYMTWSTDNTSTGPETVEIDLAAAWDAGAIDTVAEITALADWYPPAGGSGPATLTVTYDGGTPVVKTLHPSQITPATTQALAIRILQDGTVEFPGAPWSAVVRAVRGFPQEGTVYLELTETAGSLSAVADPVFAATMPSSGSGTFYFPLVLSDGAGKVKQLHAGPLPWG
jgi:hypothetical protein